MLLKNDTSIPSLTKDTRNNRQWIYGLLLVGSLIGLLASFVLSVEAIEIVRNRDVVLSCDLNSIVSCGAVARDPSAQVLGFPNSFLGIRFFS